MEKLKPITSINIVSYEKDNINQLIRRSLAHKRNQPQILKRFNKSPAISLKHQNHKNPPLDLTLQYPVIKKKVISTNISHELTDKELKKMSNFLENERQREFSQIMTKMKDLDRK